MEELVRLLPIVGLVLLFWLLLIRPASRRAKQTAQMQDSLEVGAEVMLTSGVYGTIRALREDRVDLDVAPGVTLQVARGAVGNVVSSDDEQAEDPPDDDPARSRPEPEEG